MAKHKTTVGVAGTGLFYYMLSRPQDQYDQIAVHTQKGIDFLEKYGHFVDARTKIEQEYASKLRWVSSNNVFSFPPFLQSEFDRISYLPPLDCSLSCQQEDSFCPAMFV